MFIKSFVQTLLALSLMQMTPTDGAILESRAGLPVSPVRSVFEQMFTVENAAPGSLPRSSNRQPVKRDPASLGVVTTAESVLVQDRESGVVLYAKQPEAVRPIGSITKLMTALVFLDTQPDLSASVQLMNEDYREGGRLYLAMRDAVTMQELLEASLVGSDNTATMALVRLSGLSETDFVARMNQQAVTLGMTSTVFFDPTGLSPRNVSTVGDLTYLLRATYERSLLNMIIVKPQVDVTQASGRVVTIPSTDELLDTFLNRDPYVLLGGKTGYLPEAGYCMAVGVRQDGPGDILVILLGSDSKASRVQEVKALTWWTYKNFDWTQ